MESDIVIVGGGIVGLATAYQLKQSRPDLKVTLVEKENSLAKHQTGNNSGVIHSGIYYKPGSLKAVNCINGYHMLLDFVAQHNIAHTLCGKVIVATSKEEIPALENIYQRGLQNGLKKIRKVGLEELKSIEPHVNGIEGIQVKETGIIDYKEVCQKLAEIFQASGGQIISNSKVTDIKKQAKGAVVVSDKAEINTRLIVNCAGLYSD
ncbi:MAG: FAD-dependent oxidoreductase, partial [Cytophagales bacterium]|nr:FAD-dependent oxidoreductase [Cytophagales bacterium]